jgi:GMP synthase (glutamine-hydrolysing)
MKNLNLLVVEGNIPIENQDFKQNGIPTHSESLKESLSYYTNDLNIDVFNPCNEKILTKFYSI